MSRIFRHRLDDLTVLALVLTSAAAVVVISLMSGAESRPSPQVASVHNFPSVVVPFQMVRTGSYRPVLSSISGTHRDHLAAPMRRIMHRSAQERSMVRDQGAPSRNRVVSATAGAHAASTKSAAAKRRDDLKKAAVKAKLERTEAAHLAAIKAFWDSKCRGTDAAKGSDCPQLPVPNRSSPEDSSGNPQLMAPSNAPAPEDNKPADAGNDGTP